MSVRGRRTVIAVVVLALVLVLGVVPGAALAYPLDPSYNYAISFVDAGGQYPMGIAWDGTYYWSCVGGYSGGGGVRQYNAGGAFVASYPSSGLDFRSIFNDAAGNIYARQYNDRTIYVMTAPGVFAASVTLTGGTLDSQSSVVLNGAETQFIAMNEGVVSRWSRAGTYLGDVALIGYGTMGGETGYPDNRGIAAIGDYWYTYVGYSLATRTLSEWDSGGHRLGTATLNLAGTSFASAHSFSAANGMIFVDTLSGAAWMGYLIGSTTPSSSLTFTGVFSDVDGEATTPLSATLACSTDSTLAADQTVDFSVDLNGDGDFDDPGEAVGSGTTAADGTVTVVWMHPQFLTGTYSVQVTFAGTSDLGSSSATGTVALSRPASGAVFVWSPYGEYHPGASVPAATFSFWAGKTNGPRGRSFTYRQSLGLQGSLVWNYDDQYLFTSTALTRFVPAVIAGYHPAYILEGKGLLQKWDAASGSWGPGTVVPFIAYFGEGNPDGFGIQFPSVSIPGESDIRPLTSGWIAAG